MTSMSGHPVEYNVSLESQLFLENPVLELAVLTTIRLVHSVISSSVSHFLYERRLQCHEDTIPVV